MLEKRISIARPARFVRYLQLQVELGFRKTLGNAAREPYFCCCAPHTTLYILPNYHTMYILLLPIYTTTTPHYLSLLCTITYLVPQGLQPPHKQPGSYGGVVWGSSVAHGHRPPTRSQRHAPATHPWHRHIRDVKTSRSAATMRPDLHRTIGQTQRYDPGQSALMANSAKPANEAG